LEHVILLLIELAQSLYNLVLAWIVDLLQGLLHLSFELNVLLVNLRDSLVFRVNQELKVLTFLLQLSEGSFPLDVTRISLLFSLDDLVMQLVVFFDQFLILFLKRKQSLLVQLFIMLENENFVLEFLVALSGFKKVIKESFTKVGRLNV
jgi:hypothetical protein